MAAHVRRYLIHFSLAMAGYVVLLFGSISLIECCAASTLPRAGLAMLPVLPALYALHAVLVFYRSIDEFQRRLISESAILSMLVVGFASFSYGFLEGAIDLPAIPMIWILPALIGLQGFISGVLHWRHR